MDGNKSRLPDAALLGGAVISFVLTLWLAFNDKSASATVTAILAVGLTAIRFLPLIDTVEAFGLKAKLRETVSEADDLIVKLRKTSSAATKLAYFQLAYVGRMASPTWGHKRQLMAEVDAALQEIGETEADIAPFRAPVIRFAMADLYYLGTTVIGHRVQLLQRQAKEELDRYGGGKPIDPSDAEYQRLLAAYRRFELPEQLSQDLQSEEKVTDIGKSLVHQLERSRLPPEDKDALRPLIARLAIHGARLWSSKKIDDETLDLIEHRTGHVSGWAPLYREAFGEDPK